MAKKKELTVRSNFPTDPEKIKAWHEKYFGINGLVSKGMTAYFNSLPTDEEKEAIMETMKRTQRMAE